MTPDEAFGSLSLIWYELFGRDCMLRQTEISWLEWKQLGEKLQDWSDEHQARQGLKEVQGR